MIPLLKKMIACPSITPLDAGCQAILIEVLAKMGFHIETLPFGPVKNFWARLGTTAPLVVFAGHTDVVPPGPLEEWTSPPFTPTLTEGYLVGRGTADMKGAIAAMIHACQQFLSNTPAFKGSIGFLITGDEEGTRNEEGTVKVVEHLQARGEKIDYCIVGEASSNEQVGDEIKIGRRGSLSGFLTVHGKQGHIAYPTSALNPIAHALAALHALSCTTWDEGNPFFPPTSFQFANIHAGTGTLNMIPEDLTLDFNLRYSPEISAEVIQEKIRQILKKNKIDYTLHWVHSAQPFLTKPGRLTQVVTAAIQAKQGFTPLLSTTGGTSDARFIAPTGAQVIELGVCRDSIHQVNERVKISDLDLLSSLYGDILKRLFAIEDSA